MHEVQRTMSNNETQLRLVFSKDKYPERPGYKKRDTSKRAAGEMREPAKTLRSKALAVIALHQPLTADQVADYLESDILSMRPRITELNKQGLISDSGMRAKNDSGKLAIMWRIS